MLECEFQGFRCNQNVEKAFYNSTKFINSYVHDDHAVIHLFSSMGDCTKSSNFRVANI